MHCSSIKFTRRACGRFVTAVIDVQPSCRANSPTAIASPAVVTGWGFRHLTVSASWGCSSPRQCVVPTSSSVPNGLETTKFCDRPCSIRSAPSSCRPSAIPAMTRTTSLSAPVLLGGNRSKAGTPRITRIGEKKQRQFAYALHYVDVRLGLD